MELVAYLVYVHCSRNLLIEEELNVATNNYAESNKIGEGGFGCVYIQGYFRCTHITVKVLTSVSVDCNVIQLK